MEMGWDWDQNPMGMEAYFKHGIRMGMDGNGSHILDNSLHYFKI